MPLNLESFINLRPRLFHLTHRHNADRITKCLGLHAANHLFRRADQTSSSRIRRREGMWIECDGERVHVRDQSPLHRGNVLLDTNWSFEDLVEHLNDHVFFWPGDARGPISYGRRYFQRYSSNDAVVLTLDTREVFRTNSSPGPKFSKYNSGSPRCTRGRRSPRGAGTFVLAEAFRYRPSEVIEVVFPQAVDLRNCSITRCSAADLIRA